MPRAYTGNVRVWLIFTIDGLVPSRADSHTHIPQSSLDSFWCPFRPNTQFWFFCVIFQFEVCEMMWNCPAARESLSSHRGGCVLYFLGHGKVWGRSQLGWFSRAHLVKSSKMWPWEWCLVLPLQQWEAIAFRRACGTGGGNEEVWEQQRVPELAPRLPQ